MDSPTEESLKAEEHKLIVKLEVYDSSDSSELLQSTTGCCSIDVEVFVANNSVVAELKTILQSEDYIPDDSDDLDVEVRLEKTSPVLPDSSVLPETATQVFVNVRPKKISTSALSSGQNAQLLNHQQARVTTPAAVPRSWFQHTSLSTPSQATSVPPGTLQSTQPNLTQATTTTTNPTAQPFTTEPSLLRELSSGPSGESADSTALREIITNPDVVRYFTDLNPHLREIRERNPELNYILNDPQLLRESFGVMQNPSLMRELISNTDRAIRNIDAIPGGFNTLRNLYESVEEPMWAAATSSDSRAKLPKDKSKNKTYDLRTDKEPSTEVIPSPWATVPVLPTPAATTGMSSTARIPRETVSEPLLFPESPSRPQQAAEQTKETAQSSITLEPTEKNDATTVPEKEPAPRPSEAEKPSTSRPPAPSASEPPTSGTSQPPAPSSLSSLSSSSRNLLPAAGQYPYLYQSVFPSQHRLRSLGGLGLPHAAHIRGVIRRQEPSQDQTSPPPSSESSQKSPPPPCDYKENNSNNKKSD